MQIPTTELIEGDEIAEMTADFKRKLTNRLRVCEIYIERWEPGPIPDKKEFP